MLFHIGYLQIGPVNFCVISQYVAQIEMKHETFQQMGLKKNREGRGNGNFK